MAPTTPQIDLADREDPTSMIKRLMPTRARFAVSLYDHQGAHRAYRALPNFRALMPVYSRKEVLVLWRMLRDVIESKDWHDAHARHDKEATEA